MRKMTLAPDEASYSITFGDDTLTAALSAGPSRTRADFIGAVSQASVSWSANPAQFNYLMAFWRSVKATDAFLIDMILDSAELEEYQVKFVAGSFRLGAVRGLKQVVEAQLEVKPLVSDPDYDEALLDIYEAYGEDGSLILSLLAELVNENLAGMG